MLEEVVGKNGGRRSGQVYKVEDSKRETHRAEALHWNGGVYEEAKNIG